MFFEKYPEPVRIKYLLECKKNVLADIPDNFDEIKSVELLLSSYSKCISDLWNSRQYLRILLRKQVIPSYYENLVTSILIFDVEAGLLVEACWIFWIIMWIFIYLVDSNAYKCFENIKLRFWKLKFSKKAYLDVCFQRAFYFVCTPFLHSSTKLQGIYQSWIQLYV